MNNPVRVGERMGLLTVTELLPDSKVLCVCDCGNTSTPDRGNFRAGRSKSCGCMENFGKGYHSKTNRTWCSWDNMKNRCNPKNVQHKIGSDCYNVVISERWLGDDGFKHFLEDMGDRPAGTTLERIDNRKGYFPENCCWATKKAQQNNRFQCKRVADTNETIQEYADRNNFSYIKAWHFLTRSGSLRPLYSLQTKG